MKDEEVREYKKLMDLTTHSYDIKGFKPTPITCPVCRSEKYITWIGDEGVIENTVFETSATKNCPRCSKENKK